MGLAQHCAQFSVLVAVSVCLWGGVAHAAADSEPQTYTVAGLSKPAEIIVDKWGIPHLYAQDHYDVFFVQGFNAARDRLWQIDLWRKRGLGQLSQALGPQYLEQDKATRLFLYRGDMYAEWLAYGNDAKRITQAFVAGINAYVALTRSQPDLLPPEFALLGYAPDPWQPEDVVRIRSNGLWRNVTAEVWRARMACRQQLPLAAQYKQLEPSWTTVVPEGFDPCSVPAGVLDRYRLAKAPVAFAANDTAALPPDALLRESLGSNNWVVAGSRTQTGRPILADDPHRGHATPSLRYIAHLSGPGIDVIGAGEPALPGISIGHNEKIAFGLTIFPIDQEDLYVYERREGGYLYQGRVEPLTSVTETIAVRGQPSDAVELHFTRHGPVVAQTETHLFAVRAAWLEPGMAPYFGSIEYMRAQNFREFIGALNRWGAPSENQVYADTDGNIGYKPAGRFPIRRNWDGLLPVPGDGRYEWDGYFDMDVLPEEFNPERGFTGTANSMNLPSDYPIDAYRIGFEWSAPWRYERLWEVLRQDDQHDLAASLELQRDYHSVLARRVIERLRLPRTAAGKLLRNWNYAMTPDSAAGAFWNVWYSRHLIPALSALIESPPQTDSEQPATAPPEPVIDSPSLDSLTVLELLDTRRARALALESMATAWTETQALLGEDPDHWRWGDLHQIKFRHPLHDLADLPLREQMTMPAYPRGGNANTTNNTGYARTDFDVRAGASFRMVLDVGNWDAALGTNAPGQSGDPRSPFYDNLLDNWATDRQFPLLYSRTAVEKNRALSIKLVPAN